jgi:hypothetical protein
MSLLPLRALVACYGEIFATYSGFNSTLLALYPAIQCPKMCNYAAKVRITLNVRIQIFNVKYYITNWLTNHPTQQSTVLQKSRCPQLAVKFSAFHETQIFTAVPSLGRQSLDLCQALFRSIPLRLCLTLCSPLCLGLPTGLFPSDIPTKTGMYGRNLLTNVELSLISHLLTTVDISSFVNFIISPD